MFRGQNLCGPKPCMIQKLNPLQGPKLNPLNVPNIKSLARSKGTNPANSTVPGFLCRVQRQWGWGDLSLESLCWYIVFVAVHCTHTEKRRLRKIEELACSRIILLGLASGLADLETLYPSIDCTQRLVAQRVSLLSCPNFCHQNLAPKSSTNIFHQYVPPYFRPKSGTKLPLQGMAPIKLRQRPRLKLSNKE